MRTHVVAGSGEVKLHVLETGNPAGKPILFIHGFSQCSLVWSRQMNSDLAETFRLVAMDIRGHGLSGKPDDAYSDSQIWADDVDSVIKQLELDSPCLVGWSYAGAIISDYIGSYGEDDISGTNWVGAACRLGEPLVEPGFVGEDFLAAVPGLLSHDSNESVNAALRLIDLCIPNGLTTEEMYLLLGSNMVVTPQVRQALLSRNLDNDSIVSRMRKPMLLSWGQEDAVILPKMRDHIAGLAGHAQVSTYPKTGHAPFWQAADRYNRELRAFAGQN